MNRADGPESPTFHRGGVHSRGKTVAALGRQATSLCRLGWHVCCHTTSPWPPRGHSPAKLGRAGLPARMAGRG